MRIVFFGTSAFASEILSFLSTLPHEIVGIVTRTDKPRGRDLKLGMSPVKQTALEILPGIPLFQPEKASTEEFCNELRSLNADLFFVVAYGEILKENVLSLPAKACVNVHTSLLPKYRGAAPIQRCLMNGDLISGVTFIEMVRKMDAGNILLQEEVSVSLEANMLDLEEGLLEASKKRLPEFLSNFDQYYAKKIVQKEEDVTFAAKILPEDSLMDWKKTSEELHNQIRALSPFPCAYVNIKFGSQVKRLKILKNSFSLEKSSFPPGHLYRDKKSMYIVSSKGVVNILEVQLEGKKAMKVEDFLRGSPTTLSLEI